MTIINDVRDRDEEHGAAALSLKNSDHVVVAEMKERRNLKVLGFLLATAFMILVGAILRGETQQPHYQGAVSTSFLFEKRSLLSLVGLCARRNRDFEYVDFYKTMAGISVAAGATKPYMTTVPRGTKGGISATYSAGQLKIYSSYIKDKPTDAVPPSDVECINAGAAAVVSTTISCTIRDETMEKTMYIWIDGTAATTFTLKVGNENYIV